VTAYAHVGSPEAVPAAREAIEIYERVGDLVGLGNVLNNLGVHSYYRGDWDEALDLYSRSGSSRLRAGDVIGAAASINNAAEIFSDQGKLDEAIEGFRDALYDWESSAFPVGVALASINLGRALTRSGQFAEAAESLERGLELFAEMGAESYVLETRLRTAELDLFAHRHAAAADQTDEILEIADHDESTLMLRAALHRIRAYAIAASTHVPESIEAELRRSLSAAEAADSSFEMALTYEALARLLRDDLEVPDWNSRQADIFARLGVIATPVIPLS
jgi:tetratricopeptide (TPR) repeat protein